MTLVDPTTTVSVEFGALTDIAALLALCHGFHCLNEGDSGTADDKILIEEEINPWDVDRKFSREQLEEIKLRAFVESVDENPHETNPDDAASSRPREGGGIQIRIFRQISAAEYEANGRSGSRLWFQKCIGAIVGEIEYLAESHALGYGVEIGNVRQVASPRWNEDTHVSAQGRVLWGMIEIDWGDRAATGAGAAA